MDEIKAAGGEVLAVSVDPAEVTREKLASAGLDFPLLADPDFEAIDAFGLRHVDAGPEGDLARPATFLIDAEGRIAWRDLTENYRVRPRPRQVVDQLAAIP